MLMFQNNMHTMETSNIEGQESTSDYTDRSTFIGYIRTYDEALLLVHAIRLKYLSAVEERLNPEEKTRIDSGHIFCFVEKSTGMKRWTDGRIWSPSKISGEFLIYQEVPKHLSKNSIQKMNRCNKRMNRPREPRRRDKVVDGRTLFKQTISIQHEEKLYHIISYYRPSEMYNSLLSNEFFQQLSNSLNIFPRLSEDSFLERELSDEPDFCEKYRLRPHSEVICLLCCVKREIMEKKACEALMVLGTNDEDEQLKEIH